MQLFGKLTYASSRVHGERQRALRRRRSPTDAARLQRHGAELDVESLAGNAPNMTAASNRIRSTQGSADVNCLLTSASFLSVARRLLLRQLHGHRHPADDELSRTRRRHVGMAGVPAEPAAADRHGEHAARTDYRLRHDQAAATST